MKLSTMRASSTSRLSSSFERRALGSLLGLCLLAHAACSSSSSDRPGAIDTGGAGGAIAVAGNAGAGHGGRPSGGGTTSDAGALGDSGAVGDGGAAGAGGSGYGGNDTAGAGPTLCSPTAMWVGATPVAAVSSASGESLLAMTPDELDLAFLRGADLYVAHRAAVAADFDIGSPVALPIGWSAENGAALSADGKRLILIETPGLKKLGELTRSARNAAFSGDIDTNAFSNVNSDAVYSGRTFASPVVSAGDDQLLLSSTFNGGASTVIVATRSGTGAWGTPTLFAMAQLDGDAATRRLPTGLSSDARTLFYFNEETHTEEARFRDTSQAGSLLSDMIALGGRRGAIPNLGCDRLYSEANSDVVVESD